MTEPTRNPDALLAQVADEERRQHRGRLKVFFGSNAGVGKTYAMLDEARKRAAEGVSVLVGYAEPHIRPETEALLLGLDLLPYKFVEHNGARLKEFDLDAAIALRPGICCVDELAHTNAPGLRHPERWQDVYELLDAGISVYTTLNVQHLESVNDIVERVTGVRVRETLPDHVLENADEVELVDISPDELIERLREGKIYNPAQAEHALKHFFNRGNLMALRELALRRTAERVEAQMRDARQARRITSTWAASERILVCIGPSPSSAQLVRATKRLATALRAPWYAVYVEKARTSLPADARERLDATMRLAESLGASVVTLAGLHPADEIVNYARQKNVTKIVIGKPEQPRWRDYLLGSIVDDLIRRSGDIDVHVIRDSAPKANTPVPTAAPPQPDIRGLLPALLTIATCTLAGSALYHGLGLANANVLMLYLLGVLFVSARYSRVVAIIASVVAVIAFDVSVVPPYGSLAVSDGQYLITFMVMLLTAIVISTLTQRIRGQAHAARERERRSAALLSFSQELATAGSTSEIAGAACRQTDAYFGEPAVVVLTQPEAPPAVASSSRTSTAFDDRELGVVRWVLDNAKPGGHGTDTLPAARGVYVPLKATRGCIGALGVLVHQSALSPEQLRLLEAFASQTAIAVERAQLDDESRRAWEKVEAELLRNTLLSGVSHDLRTPLAAITGAASTIAELDTLTPELRRELALQITADARRMNRLIGNLLDMTRLESAGFTLKREDHALDEIITTALAACRPLLGTRHVHLQVPPDLPLVHVDPIAMDQVFTNLLENSARYTPANSKIDITLACTESHVSVTYFDNGPGLPKDDPNRVFQKFFRGTPSYSDNGARQGLGLGLAICRGILELHHGMIVAQNREGGGACFTITLPRCIQERASHG